MCFSQREEGSQVEIPSGSSIKCAVNICSSAPAGRHLCSMRDPQRSKPQRGDISHVAYQHLLIFPTAIDVTPTGFKDLADVFLHRCHPYGVQETFAERICRDLQQIPRNVPKLTPMGFAPLNPTYVMNQFLTSNSRNL